MKGDLQISSMMKDKNCDFFVSLKNAKYNREERKRDLTSQEIVGLVQINGRESCMDSAIVLQMRTLDALVHLAWLGPRIFRGQRPREGPISNKKPSKRVEKPHLGHVG